MGPQVVAGILQRQASAGMCCHMGGANCRPTGIVESACSHASLKRTVFDLQAESQFRHSLLLQRANARLGATESSGDDPPRQQDEDTKAGRKQGG